MLNCGGGEGGGREGGGREGGGGGGRIGLSNMCDFPRESGETLACPGVRLRLGAGFGETKARVKQIL